MHYKNTVEAVYINLEELQQIVANIGADGKIHYIDIDLAMDKLRHVYDLLISMKNEAIYSEKLRAEIQKDETTNTIAEKPIEIHKESVLTSSSIKNNPVINTESKVEKEETPDLEKTRAEIDTRIRTSDGKKFLGEVFKKEKPSLNEELSHKGTPADVTTKIKSQPISSITAAIGLAEKFELIQNLFNGDKIKYEKTIEVLNSASNFNEAYDYLSSNFGWDMNDVYAQRLLELIRRKLIVRKNEQ